MKQNEMIQLLQKAGDKLKNQKLERMQQGNSENSLFTQQFLQQQIMKNNCKGNQHLLTQNELEQAIKKFHNFLSLKKLNNQIKPNISQKNSKHQHALSFNIQNVDTQSSEHCFKHSEQISQIQNYQNNENKTNHIRQKSEIVETEEIVDKLYDSLITKNIGISKPSTPKRKDFQFPIIEDPVNENTEISQFEDNQTQYYFPMIKKAFEQQNSSDYFLKLYRNHFRQLTQELNIGVKLKPHNYAHIQQKQMILKQQQKYKNSVTIIFDLDETLIHCNERSEKECDTIITVNLSKQQKVIAKINIRPNTFEVLQKLSQDFELMLFTASNKIYAQAVIQYLDPENNLFSHVLYRESCILSTGGVYIKDLRVLNRDLAKVVIIDNSPCNFAWHIDNGIPIIPFFDNKNDQELNNLYNYLINLKHCQDVREFNRKNLQLHKYIGDQKKNIFIANSRR